MKVENRPDESCYQEYLSALLRGDRAGCNERVFRLADAGISAEVLYTDLFQRSLYQVVLTGADNASWNAGLAARQSNVAPNCTVIFRHGGKFDVRYCAGIRTRGNSSRSDTPVNLRMDIPGDNPWNGRTALTLNYKYS